VRLWCQLIGSGAMGGNVASAFAGPPMPRDFQMQASARPLSSSAILRSVAGCEAPVGSGARRPFGLPPVCDWLCGASQVGAAAALAVVAARPRLDRAASRRCRVQACGLIAGRQLLSKGQVAPAQPVPPGIVAPPYVAEPEKVRGWWNSRVERKSPADIDAMRAAGQLAHAALDRAGEFIVPGRTTEEMDAELHGFICSGGAYPSDLLYKGFPKSVMISVNEVICHGIPDDRPLENGDVVNVDVTLYMGGFHADTARTWICGESTDGGEGERLVNSTREALENAIKECGEGVPFKRIGDAVCDVAERENFGVVKNLVGHGIGEFFHGVPQVFHCRNSDNRKMQEGTTFTLEPVLTEGSPEWITWPDGWTVATKDGGRAAQFEHTLLITKNGCEVLT